MQFGVEWGAWARRKPLIIRDWYWDVKYALIYRNPWTKDQYAHGKLRNHFPHQGRSKKKGQPRSTEWYWNKKLHKCKYVSRRRWREYREQLERGTLDPEDDELNSVDGHYVKPKFRGKFP